MGAKQFCEMVNSLSALFGVSVTSSDMRDLLARETRDVRAAKAAAVLLPSKKWNGAYAAALGGQVTLVFAGGISENASVRRARSCEGLEFLGLEVYESEMHRKPCIAISAGRSRLRMAVFGLPNIFDAMCGSIQ